jgi:hypothetical protein
LGLIHRQNEVKKRAINELFSALSIAIQSSSSD